jgi:hypothetical protein
MVSSTTAPRACVLCWICHTWCEYADSTAIIVVVVVVCDNDSDDDGGVLLQQGGVRVPDLIGIRDEYVPRVLQLAHRYRSQDFISAACLHSTIDASQHQSSQSLQVPIWRWCYSGRRRQLDLWSCSRTAEEAWNFVTHKLV